VRRDKPGTVKVLGLGSPHGDDQAGWKLVAFLNERLPAVAAVALSEPLGLLDHLEGCAHLVLVDACQSGATPGTVLRLTWPDPRLDAPGGTSTHGLGVGSALALARTLRRLPPRVVLISVEVESCEPGADLSPAVRAALPELFRQVLAEVNGATTRSARGEERVISDQ
jgi:hydrogenase maturation protease